MTEKGEPRNRSSSVFRNTRLDKTALTPSSIYRRRKESFYFGSPGGIRVWGSKMLRRAVAALSMLMALGQAAAAGEKPSLAHRVSCTVVRYYVAKYSEMAAEAWARGHGASEAEIQAARSCLNGSGVRTADLLK